MQRSASRSGLEIDTTTGEISGVPEVAGDVTFTVFVGDPITRELTLTVLPAAEEPEPPVDDPTEDPTDDPIEDPTDPADDPTADPTQDPAEDPTGDATAPPAAGPPAGTGGDTGTGGLPETGTDLLAVSALAGLVLVLGAALALVVRHHRRPTAD